MEPTKPDDFDSWVIVISSGLTYIGKPVFGKEVEGTDPITQAEEGKFLKLSPAYQIQVSVIPMQTGKGITMQREITALPFLSTVRDAPLWVKPNVVQLIEDLQPQDKARYKGLVEQAAKFAQKLAEQDSGIQVTNRMPGGPEGRA